jgi:hypothetical protein
VQGECVVEGGTLLFSLGRQSRIAPLHVVAGKVVPALRRFQRKSSTTRSIGGGEGREAALPVRGVHNG